MWAGLARCSSGLQELETIAGKHRKLLLLLLLCAFRDGATVSQVKTVSRTPVSTNLPEGLGRTLPPIAFPST